MTGDHKIVCELIRDEDGKKKMNIGDGKEFYARLKSKCNLESTRMVASLFPGGFIFGDKRHRVLILPFEPKIYPRTKRKKVAR